MSIAGLAVHIVREKMSIEFIDSVMSPEYLTRVPLAPATGLFLHSVRVAPLCWGSCEVLKFVHRTGSVCASTVLHARLNQTIPPWRDVLPVL